MQATNALTFSDDQAEAWDRVADLVTGAMAPQDNPLRPTRYVEGVVLEGDSFLRGRH